MEEKQHKRRVRYSGTHPRTYKESTKSTSRKNTQIRFQK